MFLFFAGTRTRHRDCMATHARCPRCGVIRAARRCRAESVAHLYWIPLFRVGDDQEVLICESCGTTWPADEAFTTASGSEGDSALPAEDAPADVTWTCSACGNVNPDAAATCLRCGSAS